MTIIPAFIRRLFCKHASLTFVRNVYGDEIIACDYMRSIWKCQECGVVLHRADLHQPSAVAPASVSRRRSYASPPSAASDPISSSDIPMSMYGLPSHRSDPEPERFASSGGGDFGGGGASDSWGDSSSGSSDSCSSSSDSGSSSCSSD